MRLTTLGAISATAIAALAHAQAPVPATEALSYTVLSADRAVGPWPMQAFAAPADARAPSHMFEGRLVFAQELRGGEFRVLRDQAGDAKSNGGAAKHLPAFDFAFVQSGDALIPQQRGPVRTSHPEWEFVLEPGRAWDQRGDDGLTRAAIPFSLQERNQNCLHNGVLTFLFGDGGRVSNVAFEIGQETCKYFQFDQWGLVRATYVHETVPEKPRLIAAHRREISGRVPTRPISRLGEDYPGADPSQFGSPLEINPKDMTLYGVVVDGMHYTGGCATRFGPYPYCDELDLPSYSLAKTMVAGFATMRAARVDPTVVSASIASLVPECSRETWADVTIGNTLDMTTGHFNSDADQHDEDADDMLPFFLAEEHAKKIQFACNHYPRKLPPGKLWVYHTSDTYLLGTALAAWYRSQRNSSADFFDDLLVKPIWHHLGLSPDADVSRRTRDEADQPFTGFGLTLLRDDVVKLALFLAVDRGKIAGEQMLDPAMVRAALQEDAAHPGLQASKAELRYKNGVWAWNGQRALGCSEPTWIPFMSGYGGITVAMFPNNTIYYYFSDGGVYAWARAAREANRIRSFCQRRH